MPSGNLRADILDYFDFVPSRDVAIVALSLFLAVSLAIFMITVKTRAWFMIIPTIVGLLEMGGYACRIRMLSHPLRGVYIAMQCLLIIPPSFLALVDYIVLGRVVAMIQAAKPSPVGYRDLKPKWLTWAFFAAEIVSLILQGAGAGISASGDDGPNDSQTGGRILLIVGLAALVIVIIFFLCTLIYVSTSAVYRVPVTGLRTVYAGLYITVALLLIRNIFRLIEFGQGWHGFISDHEVYFYVFDALMMLLWLCVMLPLHFGLLLRPVRTQLAAMSGNMNLPAGTQADIAPSKPNGVGPGKASQGTWDSANAALPYPTSTNV